MTLLLFIIGVQYPLLITITNFGVYSPVFLLQNQDSSKNKCHFHNECMGNIYMTAYPTYEDGIITVPDNFLLVVLNIAVGN